MPTTGPRFTEILRVKVGDSSFKDHTVKFHGWIRQSLAENKPYDQFVRQIITVMGSGPTIRRWTEAPGVQ
jgi:hypothetical protein